MVFVKNSSVFRVVSSVDPGTSRPIVRCSDHLVGTVYYITDNFIIMYLIHTVQSTHWTDRLDGTKYIHGNDRTR